MRFWKKSREIGEKEADRTKSSTNASVNLVTAPGAHESTC